MTIRWLLEKHFSKSPLCRIGKFGNIDTLEVKFFMNMPAHYPNSAWVKNESKRVNYSPTKKHGFQSITYREGCTDPYKYNSPPTDSKRKRAVISKTYKIEDLIKENVSAFICNEHARLFKELKSEILLDKIGTLSAKWNKLTGGPDPEAEEYVAINECECKLCKEEKGPFNKLLNI